MGTSAIREPSPSACAPRTCLKTTFLRRNNADFPSSVTDPFELAADYDPGVSGVLGFVRFTKLSSVACCTHDGIGSHNKENFEAQ